MLKKNKKGMRVESERRKQIIKFVERMNVKKKIMEKYKNQSQKPKCQK